MYSMHFQHLILSVYIFMQPKTYGAHTVYFHLKLFAQAFLWSLPDACIIKNKKLKFYAILRFLNGLHAQAISEKDLLFVHTRKRQTVLLNGFTASSRFI